MEMRGVVQTRLASKEGEKKPSQKMKDRKARETKSEKNRGLYIIISGRNDFWQLEFISEEMKAHSGEYYNMRNIEFG